MNMSNSTRSLVSTLVLVIALAAVPRAARADGTAPRGSRPEPFAACDGRQAGATCSFRVGDLTVQGTCASAPDGRLGCRPSAPPPPSEAVTACNAKQSGDACNVAFGPLTVSGTCAVADDGSLACRPRQR